MQQYQQHQANARNESMSGTTTSGDWPLTPMMVSLVAGISDETTGGNASSATTSAGPNNQTSKIEVDMDHVRQCMQDLLQGSTREAALLELSRKREHIPDLAVILWNSFGTMAALMTELTSVYALITTSPPKLSVNESNRVCNALALFQCLAAHRETRIPFLKSYILLYLYPLLKLPNDNNPLNQQHHQHHHHHRQNSTRNPRPFEYLRLTSLGVIGALVKSDSPEVINFLLVTGMPAYCLAIMETGTELSRTVATFILQKILMDQDGLKFVCESFERFSQVAKVLAKVVVVMAKEPSARLLKHVVRCYLSLSHNVRAREALKECLPDQLRNNTFAAFFREDRTARAWLQQLLAATESN